VPIPCPFLANSVQALTRSLLFAIGMDHTLIDFLAPAVVGAATVLLGILFLGIRIPRRKSTANSIPAAELNPVRAGT